MLYYNISKYNSLLIDIKEYLFLILIIWCFYFSFQVFLYIYLKSILFINNNNFLLFDYIAKSFSFLYFNQFSFIFIDYKVQFYLIFDSFSCLFFGMIFLAYPLSFLILDHRINILNTKFFLYSIYLFIVIITFFLVQNIFLFFLLYEMILIPSFLLMYNLGSSRQCIEGAIYFFIWAHFGSIFIFSGLIYVNLRTGFFNFYDIFYYNFTYLEKFILFWLFFIGFGCKIPLWPFYFWLPKAHVEAPTGLSVFLSGILVKVAFFGYYKFTIILGSDIPINFASLLPIFGVIDGSVKMFYQTDLKKIIAFATVVHMNYIIYSSLLGYTSLLKGGLFLLVNHCFSATALFFSADIIYRRHHTRLSYEIGGLFHYCPWIVLLVFTSLLTNFNFPGTLGFLGEVYVGCSSFYCWPYTTLIINFFLFFLSAVNFIKPWLDVFCGYPNFFNNKPIIDITRKEFFFLSVPIFYSFFFGLCPLIFDILLNDFGDLIYLN